MSHCDAETLTLLAIGEPGIDHDAAHLASCDECQTELTSLRSAASHAREEMRAVMSRPDDHQDVTANLPVVRLVPPPAVWDAIAAATGVTTAPRADEFVRAEPSARPRNGTAATSPIASSSTPLTPVPDVAEPPPLTPVEPEPVWAHPAQPDAPLPPPTRLGADRPRRRRPADMPAVVGIAAAALIIGGLCGYGISNVQNRDAAAQSSTSVVATTALRGLPLAPGAAGNASVVQTTGGRELDVDVRSLAASTGFYEVWLINPDVTQMVSVGVLQGADGEFTLPEGIDLNQFPLVDISVQSYADRGAHSGKSVLRGELRY